MDYCRSCEKQRKEKHINDLKVMSTIFSAFSLTTTGIFIGVFNFNKLESVPFAIFSLMFLVVSYVFSDLKQKTEIELLGGY